MRKYVIGIDYGTDSCRALVVDSANGREAASAVCPYPRWKKGLYCDARGQRYRQHPLDYTESLETAVRGAVAAIPADRPGEICALAFDTTGSTPVLTDAAGTPLALSPRFAEEPDAMFVLWKDHTAIREAAEINAAARRSDTDYTRYSGGIYSAEWVWSKVLHILKTNPSVAEAAYAWVEHCDWMCALLTGNTRPEKVLRSRCAAGHKGLWHAAWGGWPLRRSSTDCGRAGALRRTHVFRNAYRRTICRRVVRRMGRAAGAAGGYSRGCRGDRRPYRGRRGGHPSRRADPYHGNLDLRHRRVPGRETRRRCPRHLRTGRRFGAAGLHRHGGRAIRLRRRIRVVPRPADVGRVRELLPGRDDLGEEIIPRLGERPRWSIPGNRPCWPSTG